MGLAVSLLHPPIIPVWWGEGLVGGVTAMLFWLPLHYSLAHPGVMLLGAMPWEEVVLGASMAPWLFLLDSWTPSAS